MLVHADSVVRESLVRYFADSKQKKNVAGHFIRRSDNIKTWLVSKSVDKLRSQANKNPDMISPGVALRPYIPTYQAETELGRGKVGMDNTIIYLNLGE